MFSAENLTEIQLQDIKIITSAAITEHYGSMKGCGSASFCKHNVFHEDFEYGLLECVYPEVQEDRSVRGKIVSTVFANFDFPLIRYEIGDIGTWEPDDFWCSCGLQSIILMSIDGKLDDYILTPEGRKTKD